MTNVLKLSTPTTNLSLLLRSSFIFPSFICKNIKYMVKHLSCMGSINKRPFCLLRAIIISFRTSFSYHTKIYFMCIQYISSPLVCQDENGELMGQGTIWTPRLFDFCKFTATCVGGKIQEQNRIYGKLEHL